MGNDVSLQKSVVIDEKKATEVTFFWVQASATYKNGTNTSRLSLFKGDTNSEESFWKRANPLEKAGKNLMLLRHPNILKFVSSWTKGSELTLVTEHAKPLPLCLKTHNAIQICLGLRSVLQAVTFLVEKANMRHLNLCMSSIYVSDEGTWKLSGFEFLYQPTEITPGLLESSMKHRYLKAVDEKNELKTAGINLEQFAFAVLCRDIFTLHPQVDAPFLSDFQEYCRTLIENEAPVQRPKLSTILENAYFNQEFVMVHEFLAQVSLKGSFEKQEFFTDLIRKLKNFDERDVAVHLGDLLLSRLVLLDDTANMCVTPFVLDPKSDELVPGLFTTPTFVQFVIPKLKQIFMVHDAQIRMILLEHFHKFMSVFAEEDLRTVILPQLLLGIKDTNDHLVSMTLRCLADLVPILGASVVIGRNRNKIFSDGRPQRMAGDNNPLTRHWPEARSITPVMMGAENDMDLCQQSFADISTENLMPVRLAPDGGEDVAGKTTIVDSAISPSHNSPEGDVEDVDQWSDWDSEDDRVATESEERPNEVKSLSATGALTTVGANIPSLVGTATSSTTAVVDNLNVLDIQVKAMKNDDEMDFFKDMEPVIVKQELGLLAMPTPVVDDGVDTVNRLAIQAVTLSDGEGEGSVWGADGDWD